MTFILFLSSAVVGLWVSLKFTPCNTVKNSFFDCSILNYFEILSRYVLIEKTYQASWSISIDLDAQYVSSFTEVFLWKTHFKHSFMLYRIILHYFRSTICHTHILIRNVVVLPLTFLQIQASPQVCIKLYALINLSKRIFQLRDACTSPLMDRWSLHILLAPLGLTKPSGCIIYNSSLINPLRNAVLFIHLPYFIKCGNC